MTRRRWAAGGAVLWLPALAAAADWTPDPPTRAVTAHAGGEEVTCTYYRDLVVRERGTDTPAPGPAALLRATTPPPPCSLRIAGTALATAYQSFVGRRGPYLFFQDTDPNGATAFAVFDARTRRRIVDESSESGIEAKGSLHAVTATPDLLRLTFRRALNLRCSIPADPAGCWRSIVRDPRNRMPAAIARLAPPAAACARSYPPGRQERADPSVVAYETRLTWRRDGRTQAEVLGPVGCTPLP